MNLPDIDIEELKREKEQNRKERLEFVKLYAEWVKRTSNRKWSKDQGKLIDKKE